ncbi:unnamed protein product, partial [Nesidiocoris tenuis]
THRHVGTCRYTVDMPRDNQVYGGAMGYVAKESHDVGLCLTCQVDPVDRQETVARSQSAIFYSGTLHTA